MTVVTDKWVWVGWGTSTLTVPNIQLACSKLVVVKKLQGHQALSTGVGWPHVEEHNSTYGVYDGLCSPWHQHDPDSPGSNLLHTQKNYYTHSGGLWQQFRSPTKSTTASDPNPRGSTVPITPITSPDLIRIILHGIQLSDVSAFAQLGHHVDGAFVLEVLLGR